MSEMRPQDRLELLVEAANRSGDRQELGLFLDNHPEVASWAFVGDRVALSILEELNPHVGPLTRRVEPAVGSALVAYAGYVTLKDSLGFKTAPPLERMVIEHVALCWAVLHQIEFVYVRFMAAGVPEPIEFWDDRVSAAQNRFLKAVTALTRIRKLSPEILKALVPPGKDPALAEEQPEINEGGQVDASATPADDKPVTATQPPN